MVQAIRKRSSIPISIDTFYAEVAKQSLEAGADMVNDTTGGTFDWWTDYLLLDSLRPVKYSMCVQVTDAQWC